jgi:hypothetical protein
MARTKKSRHHRRPRSLGGTNEKSNISRVSITEHQAWHTLFQNFEPHVIAEIINNVWLDPDYEFILVRKRQIRAA